MPKFRCTLADTSGKILKKDYQYSSREQLVSSLKRDGYIPVEIVELEDKSGRYYSPQIIQDFTSSLSIMMESGLSLKDSLTMNGKTFSNKKTDQLSLSINSHLEKGLSLYESLKVSCSNLPPLYLGMIKIGERIGSLGQVLLQLRQYLDEKKKFRDMMIGALIYPVFVLIIVLVATLAAAIFVIPEIQKILMQFGSNSPALDQMLLKIGRFRTGTLLTLPTILIITSGLFVLKKVSSSAARIIDKTLLYIPFVKKIISDQSVYNVMYTLELLSKSGIPLEEALTESMDVIGNQGVRSQLELIRIKIMKGEKLSNAFLDAMSFPDRVGYWIQFGESSGRVEEIFGQLKTYYFNIIEKRLKLFMTMIEPSLIILIGIIIIVFVLNIIIPILTLYGSVL